MTEKRIPLKEITAEQLEDISKGKQRKGRDGNALWVHNFVMALTEELYTATTEGSSVTQKTPPASPERTD